MILFYNVMNNITPLYTKEPIPPPQHVHYILRTQDAIGRLGGELKIFSLSFIPTVYPESRKGHGSTVVSRRKAS